jgi:hypothetical protein
MSLYIALENPVKQYEHEFFKYCFAVLTVTNVNDIHTLNKKYSTFHGYLEKLYEQLHMFVKTWHSLYKDTVSLATQMSHGKKGESCRLEYAGYRKLKINHRESVCIN